jgi:putative ABC transport system ATP-binding protein
MADLGAHESGICLRAEKVNHFYGEGDSRNQVLFDNSIEIEAGQLVIMTGPSGSGKTTLLTLMGALRSVQSGQIQVLGRELSGLQGNDLVAVRRNIGFIFQMHNLFDSLTALENVKMAMQLRGCSRSEMTRGGTEILERLGLGHRVNYKPKTLSGGQRQRVAVARALVNRPKLILADEPTAALDKEASRIVVGLLKEMTTQEGCSVVMVTHDNRILELADRIVNMVDGTIRSDVVLRDALKICEFLRTVDLFKHLTPTEITNIAEKMKRRRYEKDQIIIREGDPGEEFFLIGEGLVDVTKTGADGRAQRLVSLEAGKFFGERALLVDEPRNATCAAASDRVEVFALGKADFRQAIDASPSFKDQVQSVYFQRQ